MPCRDYWDDKPSRNELEAAVNKVHAELGPLLCEACEALEDKGLLHTLSPALQKWYKDHTACEADRVAYEAAQKLTVKERTALGIDLEALKRKAHK